MRVVTNKLGLAAFMKMKGAQLITCQNKEFEFETEKSFKEWLLEYNNSCCCLHDSELMKLRALLNT